MDACSLTQWLDIVLPEDFGMTLEAVLRPLYFHRCGIFTACTAYDCFLSSNDVILRVHLTRYDTAPFMVAGEVERSYILYAGS